MAPGGTAIGSLLDITNDRLPRPLSLLPSWPGDQCTGHSIHWELAAAAGQLAPRWVNRSIHLHSSQDDRAGWLDKQQAQCGDRRVR